tara:strand:- start:3 stop:863 length:861 start_codon:yes stop_codon:yes gene_type:complete
MSFNKNFLSKSPLASHGGPHSGEELKKLDVDLSIGGKGVANLSGLGGYIPNLQKDYNKLVDFYNKRNQDGSMTTEEKQYRSSLYETINKANINKKFRNTKIKSTSDLLNFPSAVKDFTETLKEKVEGKEIKKTGARIGKAKVPKLIYEGDKRREIQLRTLGLYDQIENKDKSYYTQSDFGENFIKPRNLQSLDPVYIKNLKKIIIEQGGEVEGSKVKIPNYKTKGGKLSIENGEIVFTKPTSGLSGLDKASKSRISWLLGADDELKQIKNQYSKLFNPIKEKFYLK